MSGKARLHWQDGSVTEIQFVADGSPEELELRAIMRMLKEGIAAPDGRVVRINLDQATHYIHHYVNPTLDIGGKVRRGGRTGAELVRRIPTAEINRQLVDAHAAKPLRKWSPVTDEIGRSIGMSGRAIRMRKDILRW